MWLKILCNSFEIYCFYYIFVSSLKAPPQKTHAHTAAIKLFAGEHLMVEMIEEWSITLAALLHFGV